LFVSLSKRFSSAKSPIGISGSDCAVIKFSFTGFSYPGARASRELRDYVLDRQGKRMMRLEDRIHERKKKVFRNDGCQRKIGRTWLMLASSVSIQPRMMET
jgi:hypothetical protein